MTIGELITKAVADEKAKADAAEALRLATASLDDATTADAASDRALADGLVKTGPVFVVAPDGSALIYTSDGSGSYVVMVAKSADTTVD